MYIYILEDANGIAEEVFSSLNKAISKVFTYETLMSADTNTFLTPEKVRQIVKKEGFCCFDNHEYRAIQRMILQ